MRIFQTNPVDLIGYFFAAAVTVSCVRYLRSGGLRDDFSVFRDRTVCDWVQIVGFSLLSCAFIFSVALLSPHFSKLFQVSWLMLLDVSNSSKAPTNLMLSGARIPIFGLLFIPLLFLNLPRLAAAEEATFRDGTKNWVDAVPRSLKFGLMHMIVGVPLWVGLALAVPGMWFTREYFKGGLSRSTMAHSVYNMILASVMFAYLVSLGFWRG